MLGHLHLVQDLLKDGHSVLHLGGELPCQLIELNISPPEGCHWIAPELFHIPLQVTTPGWVIFLVGCTFFLLLFTSNADGGLVSMHPSQLSITSPCIFALLL